jgi:voltage-gated potassium channel
MVMETDELHEAGIYQVIMLFLCCYVLGALFITTVFTISPQTNSILNSLDTLICLVFIGDFTLNLYQAKDKWKYLRWGWIDLISSIPMLDIFRTGRLIRIIRILRVLRGVRSTKMLLQFIFRHRAQGAFTTVAILAFLMVTFSSIAILNVETTEGANIKTAEDALWWSFATITTVGYGDRYPVSTEGRIIGAGLMVMGVGLFGTFTAFVASWFVEGGKKENDELEEKYDRLLAEMEAIKGMLKGHED